MQMATKTRDHIINNIMFNWYLLNDFFSLELITFVNLKYVCIFLLGNVSSRGEKTVISSVNSKTMI